MAFQNIQYDSVRQVLTVILLTAATFGWSQAWTRDHYTAAVYEHNRQSDSSDLDAAAVVQSNLVYYKRATETAKQQGADIILFPEYGLFPPGNRSEIKRFVESIPDPKEATVIPCDQPELFADRQILLSLSCIAKGNEMAVVANMGGLQKCGNGTGCPEDGDLHLNTNVVFDNRGSLIARYYKEHLFFESGMDLPREPQNPVFETEFGKFATFICFDIIFEKMAKVSQEVDAVFFSTMWVDNPPFSSATQWWQAFAIGNNATLLASNIQKPGYLATGSGIFRGKTGSVAQTHSPDGLSKLIVARIPRRYEGISSATFTAILEDGIRDIQTMDDDHVPEVCSYAVLGDAENANKDYRCLDEKVENYTLVKLQKAEGHLQACNHNMCCELDYAANSMNESYYFGVYNGTYNSFDRYFWWDENCFLARCDDLNGTACSTFPTTSHGTLFHRISMAANFTTQHVYPSFVSSGIRLVPVADWTFSKKPDWSSLHLDSDSGVSIIAATLMGRVYERDPPYIR